jgi:hypothetical protein
MIITDCTFNKLRALNRTADQRSDLPSGIAGAIFYGCDSNDQECSLTINGTTVF